MYKRYNWGSLSWIIGEVFPIPLVSKMSCQKLVDQHKEPNGVAHGVSPPKHGAVDTVDEDFHEKVGAGRVLEQVPLRYQVLVSDHSTLPITPETGQDVVENVLFVAKVEEHGDE